MLSVRKLENKEIRNSVRNLYHRAFPAQERLSYGLLRMMSLLPSHHFCALYDDRIFIGMLYYVANKDQLLCCYFAIEETYRSGGYGQMVMDWIKKQASNVYVIMESVDVDCENREQRMRRQKFYKRNGLQDTGYWYVDYYDEYYDILCTSEYFDPRSYRRLGKCFTFWDRKLRVEKKI